MRNPVLRLVRGAHLHDSKLEVLSDGGKFVVQELPVRALQVSYEAGGPGTVLLEMHADLLAIQDAPR